MSALHNKLVTKQMPWHANMTELNHLGAALIAKPAIFESKMNQLFTAHRYSDNPLTTNLVGLGKEETIGSSQWEWQLKGATTRPLVSVENISGTSYPGKGLTNYKIKLDENWYQPGDIIFPGTSNKKYQSRIQEEVQKSGTGTIYHARLMTDDRNAFVPPTLLAPGQQWGKLYSQYEEAAEQSGSTQYSMPLDLTNKMGRYRKKYQVTGDAADEVLAVKIQDNKGSWHDSWVKYAEVEYWQQWYRELERGFWYSRSTDSVLGANGRPIYTGPGLQEQLEDSHIYRYSHLTAKLIEEYLMDIFYSRVKPGSQRKIKGFTGEYGMLLFHRAIQDWSQKTGFIQIVQDLTMSKTSSPYNENALQAGYQFTKYIMANGAELELVHNPLYDDREINFEIDPVSGFPIESQRITFLDFTGTGSQSNIRIINKKNGYKLGYVAGLSNPYGPNNGKLMSHSGNYYEMHVEKQVGLHIEDVTRCGELILSRN
ncbi:MAG: hypothetical protein ACTSQF_00105 [Candidatus Heimdallarchaeaceae archaeon]